MVLDVNVFYVSSKQLGKSRVNARDRDPTYNDASDEIILCIGSHYVPSTIDYKQ